MKKFFLLLFFFSILVFKPNNVLASIQNRIIANVGNQIITSYELKNKIITNLILSNQIIDQSNVNKSKRSAMLSLINYKLKKNETIKYKISANKDAVNNHLKSVSLRYNTNIAGLKELFINNNVDYGLYLDEIETEFAWQKLIYQMYGKKIVIDDAQINEELNQIVKKQEDLEEYELAEIEVLTDTGSINQKKIDEIKKEISINGFEKTAIKYSTSPTNMEGGKLGWINVKSLSSEIAEKLKSMNLGEVSDPILKTNSVLFLKLVNKRKTSINLENIQTLKDKITMNRKNELFNRFSNSYLTQIKNNTLVTMK